MERTPLASSAVASAGYDDATLVLEIEFTSGKIYQYEAVPRSVFDWLLRTPNKGSYVARMISDKYAYRDATAPAPTEEHDLMKQLQESVRLLQEQKPR
jgi:hypothetical protein